MQSRGRSGTSVWALAVLTLVLLGGYTGEALAQESVVVQFNAIARLVVYIGYMVGIILVGMGIYGFKQNAENPQAHPLSKSVSTIFAGMLLLLSGVAYEVFMRSTIDEDFRSSGRSALALDRSALNVSDGSSIFAQYLPEHTAMVLLGFVYLVGVIAFIKGLYLLRFVGQSAQQRQDGGIKTALTHITGGVVCMNITQFSCLLGSITGFSALCMN